MARKMLNDGEVNKATEQEETHYEFDLFVIGAGSGGVRAARFSANFGAKVCIVIKLTKFEEEFVVFCLRSWNSVTL